MFQLQQLFLQLELIAPHEMFMMEEFKKKKKGDIGISFLSFSDYLPGIVLN